MPKKAPSFSATFEKATVNVLAIARKELEAVAKAHRVKINAAQLIYGSLANTTIVHAPLAGIENYKDADFATGVPIQLVIVSSAKRGTIPNGSYVVTAQYRPRATSGTAIFADRTGAIVARRTLLVRTPKEFAPLFPNVDPGPVTEIPVITSTHIFMNGHYYVDCSGWSPPRTLYYETG